jgi:hypothetical protein
VLDFERKMELPLGGFVGYTCSPPANISHSMTIPSATLVNL